VKKEWWLWLLGLAGVAYLATRLKSAPPGASTSDAAGFTSDPLAYMTEAITSAVAGWKNAGQGPTWVPVLNASEDGRGLPRDLLARIAYEESRFREDIIRGNTASSAGALGIMQLEPEYYSSVRVTRPFADADVMLQIDDAATEMLHLYDRFKSWPLAIAAYNAGEGNVHKYGGIPPFKETQNYVAQVMADVPALSA
jgi:soluble lytic murein transglycosylase-like protein